MSLGDLLSTALKVCIVARQVAVAAQEKEASRGAARSLVHTCLLYQQTLQSLQTTISGGPSRQSVGVFPPDVSASLRQYIESDLVLLRQVESAALSASKTHWFVNLVQQKNEQLKELESQLQGRVHMISAIMIKHKFTSDLEEEIWRTLTDTDAAMLWAAHIGKKARVATVRQLAQALQQYFSSKLGFATIPGLSDVLLHTLVVRADQAGVADPLNLSITIAEFQLFLTRFGPLRDCWGKASSVVTADLVPVSYFHRTTSRDALTPVIQRMVAKGAPPPLASFLLRYSDSAPFVCSFYDSARRSVEHLRISNSDLGYFVLLAGAVAKDGAKPPAGCPAYSTLIDLLYAEIILKQYARSVTVDQWNEHHSHVAMWGQKVKLTPMKDYLATLDLTQAAPVPTHTAAAAAPTPTPDPVVADTAAVVLPVEPAAASAGQVSPTPSSHPPVLVASIPTAPVPAAAAISSPASSSSADALRSLVHSFAQFRSSAASPQQFVIPSALSAQQEDALLQAITQVLNPASSSEGRAPLSLVAAAAPLSSGSNSGGVLRAQLDVRSNLLAGGECETRRELVAELGPTLRLFLPVPERTSTPTQASVNTTERLALASFDLTDPHVAPLPLSSPLAVQLSAQLPTQMQHQLAQQPPTALLFKNHQQILLLQPSDANDAKALIMLQALAMQQT